MDSLLGKSIAISERWYVKGPNLWSFGPLTGLLGENQLVSEEVRARFEGTKM
jgi:hypothetical protein